MPTGHVNRLLPAVRRIVLVHQAADRTDGQLLGAFVTSRDADAFAGLVRRHGPMVLGVCRRVVGDHATAEDAFQAVFLVLARKAAAVRPREQVGNWLYGVAYRTAMKARAVLARRRSREKQVDAMPEPTTPAPSDDVWSDLRPVIDEELARLPERLRVPVVLCDLEGRPQREVARSLGVPPATLATRIATARRLLADRLTRRGVTLSGGALAGVLAGNASAHAVPHTLCEGVVRAAEQIAAGFRLATTDGGLVSAHAVHLSEGVMRMMLIAKLKGIGAAALAVMALVGGLGFGVLPAHAGDEPSSKAPPAADRPAIVIVARVEPPAVAQPAGPVDDATFLNRLCQHMRGTPATDVEHRWFAADTDPNKRAKVTDWLATDDRVKVFLAKKLGVAAEQLETVHVVSATDGTVTEIQAVMGKATEPRGRTLTFSRDGKTLTAQETRDVTIARLARVQALQEYEEVTGKLLFTPAGNADSGITGTVVLNERTFDPRAARAAAELLARVGDEKPTDRTIRVWETRSGQVVSGTDSQKLTFRVAGTAPPTDWLFLFSAAEDRAVWDWVPASDTDAEFLRRVMRDVHGREPTALEQKYFAEDKDPKKREKLLELLARDPAIAKKLTDAWKQKLLKSEPRTVEGQPLRLMTIPALPAEPALAREYKLTVVLAAGKFEKLVDELIAAKKTDEQILEAVTLAAAGRLPTPEEKRATLAVIGAAQDRKAAWVRLARALAPAEPVKPDVLRLTVPPAKP